LKKNYTAHEKEYISFQEKGKHVKEKIKKAEKNLEKV
jgi:hypothetical protein